MLINLVSYSKNESTESRITFNANSVVAWFKVENSNLVNVFFKDDSTSVNFNFTQFVSVMSGIASSSFLNYQSTGNLNTNGTVYLPIDAIEGFTTLSKYRLIGGTDLVEISLIGSNRTFNVNKAVFENVLVNITGQLTSPTPDVV